MTLTDYLRDLAARPFRYGECDCMLAVADWLRELTGKDAGFSFRGAYATVPEWQFIVARAGGLVRLVDGIAPRAGIVRVAIPALGDIAVIRVPLIGEAGAILTGERWVMKMGAGLAGARAPRVLAAWGVRL